MASIQYSNPFDPVMQEMPWGILGTTIKIQITRFGLLLIDGCLVETDPTPTQASMQEGAMNEQLEEFAAEAGRNCGQSHDLYVSNFSSSVDDLANRLPNLWRLRLLELARLFDYATPEERKDSSDWNSENGYCTHGIELGCCPRGCGSGPDD